MTARARPAVVASTSGDVRRALAGIVCAGVLAYANGLGGPFVFDDHTAIVTNERIRALTPAALAPPAETPMAGRPLVNLSLAINYALGGLDTRGYHATNLTIHLLAALALFGVVRRTLERGPASCLLRPRAHEVAFVSALIWTLHPLQTEVVNYVTQRTTSLKGLMILLMLYGGIRALGPSRRRWQTAAVVACAAGMACKESMIVAPLLMVLYDRVFVYSSLRDAVDSRRGFYAGLAASWIVLAALMGSTERTSVGFGVGVGAWTYLLNQTTMIVHYLWLAIWPRALVLDYGVPRPLALADVLPEALAVCTLAAAALLALRRWPRAGFLGAAFFLLLSPTSSVVPIVTEVGAERRMYLPLAAVVVVAVCGAFRAVLVRRRWGLVAAAAFVAVCVALGAGTIRRNGEYQSALRLAQTVVDRRPHGRSYFSLGAALVTAGRRAEGIEYFRRAKDANFRGSRYALGTEYLADGDLDAGIRELTEFLDRNPTHVNAIPARLMLGQAYAARGRLDAAAGELELFLRVRPGHLSARALLGDVLVGQDRPADALPHLRVVAASRPSDVDALGKLGTALAAAGQFEEAAGVFARAVAADPRHTRARTMLGRSLAMQGRFAEAAAELERALELAPGDEDVRDYLAEVRRRAREAAPALR